MARNRPGHQDAPLFAQDHARADLVHQRHRALDVRVDHMRDVLPLLKKECVAEAVACVGDQHVDIALANLVHQVFDPLFGAEVGLDPLDRSGAAIAQRRSGRLQIAVGHDQ